MGDEVEAMRAMFEALDTEANGSLNIDEIRAGIKQCNLVEIGEEQLQSLFKSLDLNKNRAVNYIEWLSATVEPEMIASSAALQELFRFLDYDGNQVVSLEELQRVVSPEEARRVMVQVDTDNSGTVSFEEFRHLML